MRLIVGGIMHETHTFSAEPTTLDTLSVVARGEELLAFAGRNHSLGGVIDACRERGIELAPAFFADGVSTGVPDRQTFETLAGELCERIAAALPADGVVLTLHGAMVAEGFPDAEAEIGRRVRDLVGSEIPIAVTLDLHANIGQAMVDRVDVITTYDTARRCRRARAGGGRSAGAHDPGRDPTGDGPREAAADAGAAGDCHW
jgi:microcystin degradation protein MlrC